MKKVSEAEKSAFATDVANEISSLTALRTKIDGDIELAALKTDIQSITKDYRVFLLVIPRERIDVAADKIDAVARSIAALSGKLQSRIASTSGNTSALSSQLSDLNTKVAEAQAQASAARIALRALFRAAAFASSIAPSPLSGCKLATPAIAALADIRAARQDAHVIVSSLKGSAQRVSSTESQ